MEYKTSFTMTICQVEVSPDKCTMDKQIKCGDGFE
jgi:hypothetical protein